MDVTGGLVEQSIRLAWAESERRLYPLATTSPARYEHAIVVVRAVADELRSIGSTEELMALWPEAAAIVMTAADGRGVPIGDLPVEHLAGAAFSLRHGELAAIDHRRAQSELIDTARRSARTWVVLQQRGNLDAGLLDPYQSVEMHLDTGLAIVTTVEVDPASGGPHHVLAVARLDPLTGELVDADPGVADWTEHRDADKLPVAHQALVELIESRPPDPGRAAS